MEHGTRLCYAHGCRCELCLYAARQYKQELKNRNKQKLADGTIKHGRSVSYWDAGCRCELCLEWYKREIRLNRISAEQKLTKQKFIDGDEHGTGYSYGKKKCRCELCVQWQKQNYQNRAKINKQKLADGTIKHGVGMAYAAGCRCELCLKYYRSHSEKESIDRHKRPQTRERSWKHIKTQDGQPFKFQNYERMWKEQGGKCAICGKDVTTVKTDGKYAASVDHDHDTGIVRGLLCGNCNHGLGKFKDNITTLINAIAYLQHHSNMTTTEKSKNYLPFCMAS
jgi:hypothetical protein